MSSVRDLKLRSLLIRVTEGLERRMESFLNGALRMQKTLTPIGLEIQISWKMKEAGPILFRFEYSLNKKIFQAWCIANKGLMEDALTFSMKGVQFVIPFGPQSWEQTGTYILDGKGKDAKEVWLKMLNHPIVFIVHREITELKEWEVYLEA
jgi:hypothetical protein